MHLSALLKILVFIMFCPLPDLHAQTPANPNASQTAKAVLRYFVDLKNRSENRLLLGQNLGHRDAIKDGYETYAKGLQQQTGHWIGMIGGDHSLANSYDPLEANQVFIDYWNAGGLVTLNWGFDNPWNRENVWDLSGANNLYELLNPGSQPYQAWQEQLEEVAAVLEHLQDAGVVVLWRPFHEMNGDWFWYGNHPGQTNHQEALKAVWRDMFEFLTDEKGLNNLLWVYSLGNISTGTAADYYPGAGFVDITGIDIYDDDTRMGTASTYADLVSLGHPIGLTEVGPDQFNAPGNYDYRRLLSNIKSNYPEMVFAMAWHDWTTATVSFVRNQHMTEVMNDPWVINRSEIDLASSSAALFGEAWIRNAWTGNYLNQDQNQPGTSISMRAFQAEWWSQRWHIEKVAGGYHRLRCQWDNLYLHSTSTANEAVIRAWNNEPSLQNQQWNFENVSGNTYRIKNRTSGHYLYAMDETNVGSYDYEPLWHSQLWIIEPTTPTFSTYMLSLGITGEDANLLADPDLDGHSNLLEWALGSHPGDSASLPQIYATTIGYETPSCQMTFPQRAGTNITVEGSYDLTHWTAPVTVTSTNPQNLGANPSGTTWKTYQIDAPSGGLSRGYLRLRVTE